MPSEYDDLPSKSLKVLFTLEWILLTEYLEYVVRFYTGATS